ncbi:MAG: hypothetical protein MJ249_11310 [Kiritimatiellae bacterium]|nr:hypothetical protein [Kiritimatiellia bacterium]
MEMSEFLRQTPVEETVSEELDVQKAVVESLAADKAEQDERIDKLLKENHSLKSQILKLNSQIEEMKVSLAKVGDVLAANGESALSTKVTLLERDPEVNDRFPGETRDHVLEVIKAARDVAEKEGRTRRAQLLESVLVANDPIGNLAKKRQALEKFFNDNGNILSTPVIAELEKCGISHKKGEEYLLTSEIIKRTY